MIQNKLNKSNLQNAIILVLQVQCATYHPEFFSAPSNNFIRGPKIYIIHNLLNFLIIQYIMYTISDRITYTLMTVYESKSIILNLFYNFIFL